MMPFVIGVAVGWLAPIVWRLMVDAIGRREPWGPRLVVTRERRQMGIRDGYY